MTASSPAMAPPAPGGPGLHCDPETGLCAAPSLSGDAAGPPQDAAGWDLTYVGDPMCSWCWGIAPVVARLPTYCDTHGAAFSIVAGGLRPGGGDPWNAPFKNFLRQEWQHIGRATGQPFSLGLLERPAFHYDTEPPCRAVVVARQLLAPRQDNQRSLATFFGALQHDFYVGNGDPGQLDFYRHACRQVGLAFDDFAARFSGDEARREVLADFQRNRGWGVRGYPSFVLRRGPSAEVIASGYIDFAGLTARVERALEREAPAPGVR